MLYLIIISIILIFSVIYFKFIRTKPSNFFFFIGLQLTAITTVLYVFPIRRALLQLVGIDVPTDPPPVFVYPILVVALLVITWLFVKYESQKASKIIDKQTELADLKDSSIQEQKENKAVANYKMRKPTDFDVESGLFYERIERIFNISYGSRCDLSINKELEILYGETHERGDETPIFIKCDSSGANNVVQSVTDFQTWIDDYYAKKTETPIHKDIYYIYLDSVANLIQPNVKLKFSSETDLMLKFFSVRTYLNGLIRRYKDDKLPFSIREEGEKFSLSDTFVQPSFNDLETEKSLEEYLNQWLDADKSPRQMAILGGYGTGKSSFLLHYAAKLAENYILDKGRIPVLISLTNVSPMHDKGLKDRLSKTAHDMGISYTSLLYLIEKQQVVLLLDGFDEMGYVGSREHRLQHFESIWQLATNGNKIIIAGRPSYFFGEQELNKALQAIDKNELISDDLPHCHVIKLQGLAVKEIELYLHKYFSAEDVSKYLEFIQSHQQLFDLAARPSLMHMIREMIGEIYNDANQKFSAATLMEKYVHHWIVRQDKKQITGNLS